MIKNGELYEIISMWNQWDLHLHTPGSYDYEDTDGFFTPANFVNNFFAKNIKLVAITDHNEINQPIIESLIKYAAGNRQKGKTLTVLPGVELNIDLETAAKSTKFVHLILVFSENSDMIALSKCMGTLKSTSPSKDIKKMEFTVDQIVKSFMNFEFIPIVHWGKSANSPSTESDKEKVCNYILGDFIKLAENNPANNMKNQEKLNRLIAKTSPEGPVKKLIITSDCHDLSVYPRHDKRISETDKHELTFFKAVPSFEGLRIVTTDASRICNDKAEIGYVDKLSNNQNRIKAIKFQINEQEKTIYFSRELNAIIGPRSSGKTLLIAAILRKLGGDSDSTITEYDEMFRNKLKDIKISVQRYSDNDFIEIDKSGLKAMFARQNDWMTWLQLNKSNPLLEFVTREPFKEFFSSLSFSDEQLKLSFSNEIKLETDFFNNLNTLFEQTKSFKFLPSMFSKYCEYSKNDKNKNNLSFYTSVIDNSIYMQIENRVDAALNHANEALTGYQAFMNYLFEKKRIEKDTPMYLALENLKTTIEEDIKYQTKVKNGIIAISEAIDTIDSSLKLSSPDESFHKAINGFLSSFKTIGSVVKKCLLGVENDSFMQSREFSSGGNKTEVIRKSLSIQLSDKYKKDYIFSLNIRYYIDFTEEIVKKINLCFYADSLSEGYKGLVKKVFSKNISVGKLYKSGDLLRIQECLKPLTSPEKKYDIFDSNDNFFFSKCSPGRKLSVLLELFFSKKNSEIIVFDQPEDHLDSKYIAGIMTEYIRNNKSNKQMILATHNANIVVNADSENVICCNNLDNSPANISYTFGGIEYADKDFSVRDFIVSNLEGGDVAFETREKKYKREGIL